MKPSIQEKLDTLPTSPGVYLFKDEVGCVLYVGKARNLRSRVRSYFQPGSTDTRYFISRLEKELGDLETLVVGTEKEAALLENTLIKQHHPRYNFKLRDDKEYLSMRLDRRQAWPRLEVVRRPEPDGALYFGPYPSASSARSTLRVVNRHFQLRTCSDAELSTRTRPCLQYQIKRCPAPCVREVEPDLYAEQVRHVGLFLDGRRDELLDTLEQTMRDAAAELQYERAARLRDQIRAVERVMETNRVAVVSELDQDALGLFRQADQAQVALLRIRGGKLSDVRSFGLRSVRLPDDDLLASFVRDYYQRGGFVPAEILLPLEVEVMEGLAALLSDLRGKKVRLLVPKRGDRAQIVEMARDNAEHSFREQARAREDLEQRLGALQQKLRLPALPRRIECLDISHTGGDHTVGSIVMLVDGTPEPARYRSFKLQRVSGGDDYGAMHEVLSRRFRRGRDGDRGWELPDLLVVDGGKGQLNVALGVLRDLGVSGVSLAGLAKERELRDGDRVVDRIYLPGQKNPIELRSQPAALGLLALARDEAHRSSNRIRSTSQKRTQLRSRLDDVPGVGVRTRDRLLRRLGSLKAVQQASETELRSAGATRTQARAIVEAFHGPARDGAPPSSATPNPEVEEQVVPPSESDPCPEKVMGDADWNARQERSEEQALDNAFGSPSRPPPEDSR